MVFVPRMPLGRQLLGLDTVPRAVPSDLLVALGSRVLPAAWLQQLILVAIVVGGAWGAGRFVPTASRTGVVAAATAYGWSPYLHERLLLGQWALLIGWAVLPWAAHAAGSWRRGESGWSAVACLAVAATGGASAVLLVALVVLVLGGHTLRTVGATALLSLPWLVPAVLHPVVTGDPAGVTAFAARSDTPFGVLISVLQGGGVWAPAAVPPGRAFGAYVALLVLVVAALGMTSLLARVGPRLLVLGLLSLGLALLGRLPGGADLLRWAVQHLPAAGLLRDGQKWVAPLTLLTAAGVGCGAERVLRSVSEPAARRLAGVALALLPVAALPGALRAEGGRLQVSHYPLEWTDLTARTHGQVVVLPWTLYRAFPWTQDRTVLDPATKLLSRPVLNDSLPLADGEVAGEDPLAAALRPVMATGEPLLAALQHLGISQVLVEKTTRGADLALVGRQIRGLDLVQDTPDLTLYDVPGPTAPSPAGGLWPSVLADGLAAGFGLLAGGSTRRRRRQRHCS